MPHGKLKIYSNIVNFYGTIELPLILVCPGRQTSMEFCCDIFNVFLLATFNSDIFR